MLVLTRKIQEQIQIGDNITITILRMKGQAVRVGIDAPKDIRICRGELPRATTQEADTGGLAEDNQEPSSTVVANRAEFDVAPSASHESSGRDSGRHGSPQPNRRASNGPPRLQTPAGRISSSILFPSLIWGVNFSWVPVSKNSTSCKVLVSVVVTT